MILPRAVRAVVFDMDGLLVDSEVLVREVMMHISAVHGVDLPMSVFLRMVGLPGPASRKVAVGHFGEDFDYDRWNTEVWAMTHARIPELTLKPGVAELIDLLDAKAAPRAIATSSSHVTAKLQLTATGIFGRFDTIVASGDYARGKPAPDPYLTAASRLGIDPADCLALEDSHNGVRAAHAAGMMTVMVPDLLPATDEIRRLCVGVADSLHTVAQWLRD